MSVPKKIIVIGAGISGLAAAHRLVELSRESGVLLDVKILEAADRAGGVIRTQRRDGFLWEEGPDSFITDKPWALDLCRRLGLESEIIGTNPQFQKSYVLWGGKLHATPEGFYLLAPTKFWPFVTTSLFSWPGKLRMGMDLFLPARKGGADESLGDFVRRRFGREALVRMAQPMVAGIYTADAERLSLKATFPRFLELEARHGSVIRGLWEARRRRGMAKGVSGPRYGLFVTLKNGLSTWVDALTEQLPPGAIRLRTQVQSVERRNDSWRVSLGSGETLEADALVVSLSASGAAQVLKTADSVLSDELSSIPYADSATVHLAYDRAAVKRPLDAFGFVVPEAEKRAFIGCTFTSVKFAGRAPEGKVMLRAFVGGPALKELLTKSGDDIARIVHHDLSRILGITGLPLFASVWRGRDVMPHYVMGHQDRVRAIEERLKGFPGLALAGNGYHGLGLPDCVHSGERAAQQAFGSVFQTDVVSA